MLPHTQLANNVLHDHDCAVDNEPNYPYYGYRNYGFRSRWYDDPYYGYYPTDTGRPWGSPSGSLATDLRQH